jgi:hypothetical protein
VLFPTAPDGIRGEVCVTRYPFDDIVSDAVQAPPPPSDPRTYLPLREMEHCAVVDRVIEALRRDGGAGVAADLSPNHSLAVRLDDARGEQAVHTATDREHAAAALVAMCESAVDITLMTRIATDWYVFVEYLMQLDGGGVRRLALTHPVENGLLTGTFGYGRDER